MKNSWTKTFRRLAAGAVVAGSMAFSSALSYAQLAYDSASDPVYADGWQAGDNGGFGFTAWNFDSGYWWQGTRYDYHGGIKEIDDGLQNGTQFSNPFNDIGTAWTVGVIQYQEDPDRWSFPRVGRGFPALKPGQTFGVVFDNPLERTFFKGYFVRLNGGTGGVDGNICNAGYGCSAGAFPVPQINLRTFEYYTDGRWDISDAGFTNTPLRDTDTGNGGVRMEVTLIDDNSGEYKLTMSSVNGSFATHTHFGTLANPGVGVDWFELQFFLDIESDSGTPPTMATDFYIREMWIVPEPGTGILLLVGAGLGLLGTARRRREE